jgi:hypothetical protein
MSSVHELLDRSGPVVEYMTESGVLKFKSPYVTGSVVYDGGNDTFVLTGETSLKNMQYMTAVPFIKNYSYAGSGLPFPNAEMAHEQTPDHGPVKVDSGAFAIRIPHPSEYYTGQGKVLTKPHVHFFGDGNQHVVIMLGDYFPNRSLKNLPGHYNRTIGR